MNIRYNIYGLLLRALPVMAGAAICACDNTDESIPGNPFFAIYGVDGAIMIDAEGTDMSAFTSGKEYDVKARGAWVLIPEEGSETDWAKVYPLSGTDEGVIRVYASTNTLTQRRTATYNVAVNGVIQDNKLIIQQAPTPAQIMLSADNIRIHPQGGSASFTVNSNVEWTLSYDTECSWMSVVRDGNKVTVNVPDINDSGSKRVTTISVCGLEPYETTVHDVTVTQLYAIYFEDFSWIPNTQSPALCWVSAGNEARVDQWPSKFKDKVDDPSVLTAWGGMATADKKVLAYSSYNYIKLGSSTRTGNICSPAISSIEGEINAVVSWNMAGFCKKTNERVDCNRFYAAILGPGRITEANASGRSEAWLEKGFQIPYSTTASGTASDIMLSEIAGFEIGPDGYFDTNDKTGLNVWNSPESAFSMRVEGMTASTRIVFIAGEADKVTVLNDWLNTKGSFADSRKLFDNFIIEQE